MGIRTVRLDDEAETVLTELQQRTGLSISAVLKRGLAYYASNAQDAIAETPYEIFKRLDLGPGGYAVAPAAKSKATVASVIKKKRHR